MTYTKEDIQRLQHVLTVGDILDIVERYNLPRDTKVLTQRIEDVYFEECGWSTYNIESLEVDMMRLRNIEARDMGDRGTPHTEEEIELAIGRYVPAHCCVYNPKDEGVLLIDLHY